MLRLFLQNASGNAAKAGLKSGDTVIYTSSFFGDELWPADQLGFARTALSAAPSPVSIVYVRPSCSLFSKVGLLLTLVSERDTGKDTQ